ncbi:uncharacterized protein LOC111006464 [Momordica charantia]|uniref:Uncharacterized protein LOC111006464 n=1 Tax=Momordica charantia TaxID=3673 RepID=A0A6J1BX58_MOMCH|nr:uncharacterized protein LOC111006464 [Momordica charantia]
MAAMEAEETEEEGSPQFWKELTSPPTMEDDGALDFCPSFNSYSIDGLANTAARVTREFEGMGGGEEDEFEFVSFQKTGEQMVFDCPIGSVFPIFNYDLLEKSDGAEVYDFNHGNAPTVRISLEKLIIDDRDRERDRDRDPPSSSSSDADELDGIPPGTYCVWTPKPEQEAERGKCKKSKSTGSGSSSSRRWRLRNLLPRSNSEGGKNLFVFLTPSSKAAESTRKKEEKSKKLGEGVKGKKSCSEANVVTGKSKVKGGSVEKPSSAHELFYMRNRMLKEGDRRRSYLPYRQELVGFWANLNSASKAFPPF